MYTRDVLYVVLQLTTHLGCDHGIGLDDHPATPESAALFLGCTLAEAELALTRLAREGLLADHRTNRWLQPNQYEISARGLHLMAEEWEARTRNRT